MCTSVRRYKMGAGALESLTHRVDTEFAPPAGAQRANAVALFVRPERCPKVPSWSSEQLVGPAA